MAAAPGAQQLKVAGVGRLSLAVVVEGDQACPLVEVGALQEDPLRQGVVEVAGALCRQEVVEVAGALCCQEVAEGVGALCCQEVAEGVGALCCPGGEEAVGAA